MVSTFAGQVRAGLESHLRPPGKALLPAPMVGGSLEGVGLGLQLLTIGRWPAVPTLWALQHHRWLCQYRGVGVSLQS